MIPADQPDCFKACKYLDQVTAKREDYCAGGAIEVAVQGCPAARVSLKATIPAEMCAREAWAHVKCNWAYTREARLEKEYANLSGSLTGTFNYAVEDDKCNLACQVLGDGYNLAAQYCPGQKVYDVVESCPAGLKSLKSAVMDPKNIEVANLWCKDDPKVQEELFAVEEAYMHGFAAELCTKSFENGCWRTFRPYQECCSNCGSGSARASCQWEYTDGKDVQVNGTFRETSEACFDSCNILRYVPERTALCPGGTIYKAIEKKKCETALRSVRFALQKAKVTEIWCP